MAVMELVIEFSLNRIALPLAIVVSYAVMTTIGTVFRCALRVVGSNVHCLLVFLQILYSMPTIPLIMTVVVYVL
jgi:hypothetical protein